MIACLNKNGVAAIVSSPGVLHRGKVEQKIRENMIKNDIVEAIIELPEKIFYGTPIPGCIIIFNKNKEKSRKNKVLFIHASEKENYQEEKVRNVLREKDMQKIIDTFQNFSTGKKYSYVAEIEEIAANGYNWNIPRYVNIFDSIEEKDPDKAISEFLEFISEYSEEHKKIERYMKELQNQMETK